MTFNPKFLVFLKFSATFSKRRNQDKTRKIFFVTVHLPQTGAITLIKRFLFEDQEKTRKNLFFSRALLIFYVNFPQKSIFFKLMILFWQTRKETHYY